MKSGFLFISLIASVALSEGNGEGLHELPPLHTRVQSISNHDVYLPQLMKPGFYLPSSLCADARIKGKKFALVGIPGYQCESRKDDCTKMARAMSDPCNLFIRKHFSIYQTRFSKKSIVVDGMTEELPGAQEIKKEWLPRIGGQPGIAIMDATNCTVVGSVPAFAIPTMDSVLDRELAMKESIVTELRKVKVPSIELKQLLDEKTDRCLDSDRRKYRNTTLTETFEAIQQQTYAENPYPWKFPKTPAWKRWIRRNIYSSFP